MGHVRPPRPLAGVTPSHAACGPMSQMVLQQLESRAAGPAQTALQGRYRVDVQAPAGPIWRPRFPVVLPAAPILVQIPPLAPGVNALQKRVELWPLLSLLESAILMYHMPENVLLNLLGKLLVESERLTSKIIEHVGRMLLHCIEKDSTAPRAGGLALKLIFPPGDWLAGALSFRRWSLRPSAGDLSVACVRRYALHRQVPRLPGRCPGRCERRGAPLCVRAV